MKIKSKVKSSKKLLKDLSEIKAVLDVESKLMRALILMSIQRQTAMLSIA